MDENTNNNLTSPDEQPEVQPMEQPIAPPSDTAVPDMPDMAMPEPTPQPMTPQSAPKKKKDRPNNRHRSCRIVIDWWASRRLPVVSKPR